LKKMTLAALLLCAALSLTACAPKDIGEYYQTAQLYLGCGDYEYAAELFEQLGECEDAADYALYCRGLQAMEEGNYDIARANLMAVNPFKSSGRYLMYLDALEAEKKEELEAALTLYEKLGTFEDSHLAVERLQEEIPEAALKKGRALMNKGEYEAARDIFLSLDGYGTSKALANNCTTALNKAAYNAAEELYDAGDLQGAMAAFLAMGDTMDAAKRAEEIRTDILGGLDEQYAAVTLATAPAVIEAYQALPEDEMARGRIAELTARFGSSLMLLSMDDAVVQLGCYPQAESGEEQPVLWRVIKKEGTCLTLLSEYVLDASAEATGIPVVFSDAERNALSEMLLPSMTDLAGYSNLACDATPYAIAQGAQNPASYWLRDSLENGLHPVIGANGTMNLPAEGAVIGVRPMMILDLEKITFTQGDGTPEAPFAR